MIKETVIYLVAINLFGAIINIIDKEKAKHGKWRIKESTLWTIALIGGAPLSYITMKLIRHKTKHKSFMIGFPIIAVIQIATLGYYLINM